MENVNICDITQAPSENFFALQSSDGRHFYWHNAGFLDNQPGDYIFVVNNREKEALLTRLTDKAFPADYDPVANQSRILDDSQVFTASGKWERFLRFDVLEKEPMPPKWNLTIDDGVYDLWRRSGIYIAEANRLQKIKLLREIFPNGKAAEILQKVEDLLNGIDIRQPEIVIALKSPDIREVLELREFFYQKAKDKLDELLGFQSEDADDEFYPRLIEQVARKDGSFLEFLENLNRNSNEYRLLRIIGELIAYCDRNAAGKQVFNLYDDKRTLAFSFVRQTQWVLNLLRYKERNGDLNAITSPSIQNAISYLLDPMNGLTLLSEDHRQMVARYLYRTAYDRLSFIRDTFSFFEPYVIRPANPANVTMVFSKLLYSKKIKERWLEKIEGLVVADNTDWLDKAVQVMQDHPKMVLWWDKMPSGGASTQKFLREQLDERGFFYIYYARLGEAHYRSRIIDFAIEKDYPEKNWNQAGNVGWYEAEFKDYTNGSKKARITFLAEEVIKLKTPIPYKNFEFFQDYQSPTQNNMQPYAEVIDDTAMAPPEEKVAEEVLAAVTLANTTDKLPFDNEYRQILMAARTKPFVLLAGISGIGKSRLARVLAYKTCAISDLQQDNKPLNFELIQVKPNWNDSTALLGYYSPINGKYKVTSFMKFLIRSWQYLQIPFFLCVDEMNLAPVEHYMAEYLSAIESRNYVKGVLITDPLISPEVFANSPKDFWEELGIPGNKRLQEHLTKNGLGIPHNLVVIGTVNIDETTHAFSRKVLDRAMTIEMTDVDLHKNLNSVSNADLAYPKLFYSKDLVCGVHTSAGEIFSRFTEGGRVIEVLSEINDVLKTTPFRVAYRVRDETLVYCYYHSLIRLDGNQDWLTTALDEIICMKILSRIEGDHSKCKQPLEDLAKIFDKEGLKICNAKLQEMTARLESGYTSFFP